MSDPRRFTTAHWLTFAAATAIGLTVAFCLFAGLLLGECLPRDGSAAIRACDAAKGRDLWLFPLLVAALVAVAIWLRARALIWSTALMVVSGVLAAFLLWWIDRLFA